MVCGRSEESRIRKLWFQHLVGIVERQEMWFQHLVNTAERPFTNRAISVSGRGIARKHRPAGEEITTTRY